MKNIVILLLLLSLLPRVSKAQNDYLYSPVGSFRLGFGFTKEDYTKSFPVTPFTYKEQKQSEFSTGYVLNTEVIYDEKTLGDKLHFDAKVSTKSLKLKASAQFNLDIEKNFNFSSLNILVEASTEFGKTVLTDLKLKPEASKLLNDPADLGHKKFIEMYGSNFISEQRNGVSLYALISISNVSNQFRQSYGFKASGSLKVGAFSSKMSLNLNKEIFEASKTNRLQYKVWGVGGAGISLLSGVFNNLNANTNCLEAITTTLSEYVKTLDFSKSAPIGFKAASYSIFGMDKNDPWTEQNEDRIADIFNEYQRLHAVDRNLVDLLSPDNEYFQILMPAAQQTNIKKLQQKVKDQMAVLAALHAKALKDPDNRDAIPKPMVINLDAVLPAFPEFTAAYVPVTTTPSYGAGYLTGGAQELSSPTITTKNGPDGTFTSYYTPLLEPRLPGLVIYNNFNNRDYFQFIEDVKIYKNDALFQSFKKLLNNDQKLSLTANDFRSSAQIVNLDKLSNFSVVTSAFKDDYQKMVQNYNTPDVKRIDVDYKIVIEDVFQHQFESPLFSDHRDKNIMSGGKQNQGLPFLGNSLASTITANFDVPTFGPKDTLFTRVYFIMPKITAPNNEPSVEIRPYSKDPNLMIVGVPDMVNKYKYSPENIYQLLIQTPYNHVVKGYEIEYWVKMEGKSDSKLRKRETLLVPGKFSEALSKIIPVNLIEFID